MNFKMWQSALETALNIIMTPIELFSVVSWAICLSIVETKRKQWNSVIKNYCIIFTFRTFFKKIRRRNFHRDFFASAFDSSRKKIEEFLSIFAAIASRNVKLSREVPSPRGNKNFLLLFPFPALLFSLFTQKIAWNVHEMTSSVKSFRFVENWKRLNET